MTYRKSRREHPSETLYPELGFGTFISLPLVKLFMEQKKNRAVEAWRKRVENQK